MQILATEHFVLQGARSAATMESNARSSLYLTVLSATFVALALVSQVSGTRQVLTIFAPIALSVVFFLGVATFMRVLENGVEDWIYVAGINRFRHFYIEVAPETAPYFVLPPYDDVQGVRATMGIPVRSPWQRFLTAAATISVINSLVGGVLAGAVAHAFTSSDALSFRRRARDPALLLGLQQLRAENLAARDGHSPDPLPISGSSGVIGRKGVFEPVHSSLARAGQQ